MDIFIFESLIVQSFGSENSSTSLNVPYNGTAIAE